MLLKEYDNKRALIRTSIVRLPSERKIRNCNRVKKTARHHDRRARELVEAGMPSRLLGPYRSVYYDRQT